MTLGIPAAILTESGLSFLGLGVQPPYATWGNILNEGKDAIEIGVVALGLSRGWRSSSRCCPTTSSARGFATRSTRACVRASAELSAARVAVYFGARSSPKWRNWQTRTFEGRVGQPVGVRVPPSAPSFLFSR